MNDPFPVVFARAHPFGFLVGVALPPKGDPLGVEVLTRLDAGEAAFAKDLAGFRQIEWVGGRLAAQAAGRHYGARDWSVRVGPRREPIAPGGFSVTIAHKRTLAVALVTHVHDVGLGIDVENDRTAARAAADLVLSEDERAGVGRLPREQHEAAFVVAFALKEAAYKALQRRSAHPLTYRDARVQLRADGVASILVTMPESGIVLPLDVSVEWYEDHVIAAVTEAAGTRPRSPSNSAR